MGAVWKGREGEYGPRRGANASSVSDGLYGNGVPADFGGGGRYLGPRDSGLARYLDAHPDRSDSHDYAGFHAMGDTLRGDKPVRIPQHTLYPEAADNADDDDQPGDGRVRLNGQIYGGSTVTSPHRPIKAQPKRKRGRPKKMPDGKQEPSTSTELPTEHFPPGPPPGFKIYRGHGRKPSLPGSEYGDGIGGAQIRVVKANAGDSVRSQLGEEFFDGEPDPAPGPACQQCGKPLAAKHRDGGPDKKFCNASCRYKAWSAYARPKQDR